MKTKKFDSDKEAPLVVDAFARSWDQRHPTFVPNSLAFLNSRGETVFVAGDVIDDPDMSRVLDQPGDTN